ncbi:MAG: hypothetical protein COA52_00720 [Hyphomicrobiales bacterium]|nr:MAG: hypothetical protein COA52_00720 [Hyphomicrobiales bacterium]
MNIQNIKFVIRELKAMKEKDFYMGDINTCISALIQNRLYNNGLVFEDGESVIKFYFKISVNKSEDIYCCRRISYEKATRKVTIKMLKHLIKTNKVDWNT